MNENVFILVLHKYLLFEFNMLLSKKCFFLYIYAVKMEWLQNVKKKINKYICVILTTR